MAESKRYHVVLHTTPDNKIALLWHRGRTEWTKRTAIRHADEYAHKHGQQCYLVDSDEPLHCADSNAVYKTMRTGK